jgi:phosphonopyruvate decarboxylase
MKRPANLAIVVLDNGVDGETGLQPSHTSGATDLVAVARGCGIAMTLDAADDQALAKVARLIHEARETLFARVRIAADDPPRVLPLRDGVALKLRFRRALGLDP